MIFYYYPITCATAAHIILLESGLDFEYHLVDLQNSRHLHTDYVKFNPKGAVPALLLDDGLLTENQAILTFIADSVAEKNLIPAPAGLDRARAHEWMNFCAASLHPAIRSIFRPAAYAGEDQAVQHAVQAQGIESLKKYASIVEQKLQTDEWALGAHFSVCDAYLYLMYLWSQDSRISAVINCPKWRQLALRVHARTSTRKALSIEMRDRPDYRLPKGFDL